MMNKVLGDDKPSKMQGSSKSVFSNEAQIAGKEDEAQADPEAFTDADIDPSNDYQKLMEHESQSEEDYADDFHDIMEEMAMD